mmetsp:Transcript_17979/g.63155  ORF Transcript_17979/g.63155 Transcript_17979/m.63155 type:complete len:212 (-) Transcript_17979:545-1180(-)
MRVPECGRSGRRPPAAPPRRRRLPTACAASPQGPLRMWRAPPKPQRSGPGARRRSPRLLPCRPRRRRRWRARRRPKGRRRPRRIAVACPANRGCPPPPRLGQRRLRPRLRPRPRTEPSHPPTAAAAGAAVAAPAAGTCGCVPKTGKTRAPSPTRSARPSRRRSGDHHRAAPAKRRRPRARRRCASVAPGRARERRPPREAQFHDIHPSLED